MYHLIVFVSSYLLLTLSLSHSLTLSYTMVKQRHLFQSRCNINCFLFFSKAGTKPTDEGSCTRIIIITPDALETNRERRMLSLEA